MAKRARVARAGGKIVAAARAIRIEDIQSAVDRAAGPGSVSVKMDWIPCLSPLIYPFNATVRGSGGREDLIIFKLMVTAHAIQEAIMNNWVSRNSLEAP